MLSKSSSVLSTSSLTFLLFFVFVFTTQKYQFVAEDLEDKGHLGEGAFGTVSKMVFNKTKTLMAVKVNISKVFHTESWFLK